MSTQEPTMTEHDMTDHVAAIKELLRTTFAPDPIGRPWSETDRRIRAHADALAARLATYETMVDRLSEVYQK